MAFPPVANPDLDILRSNTPLPEEGQVQEGDSLDENENSNGEDDSNKEEIDRIILEIFKHAEDEDLDLRYPLIRQWRRNDLYFNNLQTIFYDDVARDYRTFDSIVGELQGNNPTEDIKIINIYRAYAESIIAALAVQPPSVQYLPDDAEDPDDLETAEAYSKIGELVAKHNHSGLMLIKALTILYNCGVIAAHNYYKQDPAYGTYKKPKNIKQAEKQVADLTCKNCFTRIDSNVSVELVPPSIICPNCGFSGPATVIPHLLYEDEVIDYEETPKGRSGFDIFGPTNVKLPLYSRNQEGIGYLILRLEDHVAKFRAAYDDEEISAGGGDTQLYERWGRIPIEYYGVIPTDLTTARYGWFRPWYYHLDCIDPEDIDLLKSKYPNGFKCTVIDDKVYDVESSNLDDEWTLTFDPRANFIHAEPAGNSVIPIQDAKNDLFNLGLQSIEFGIPETYVHPKTVNLKNYSEGKSSPGMLTQAMPPGPDKSLSDGFYQQKPATLSSEYTTFDRSLDQTGQFVSAAMPSLWGGSQKNGDTTASEYSQSRSQALQRIQITWDMIEVFWPALMFKCVKDYATNLQEDEKFVKSENGTFVNIWIQKSALQGKVGHVEPELSGSLPQSWAQKKDFIMKLIEMQSPEVGQILLHPNNSELLKRSTGMRDLYIPGENDRNKQFQEYYELSKSKPIDEKTPSIMIDIDVDDHLVHMQVLKNILVSLAGVSLYKTFPAGYQNCIAHYRQHEMAQQAKSQEPSGSTGPGEPAESSSKTAQG